MDADGGHLTRLTRNPGRDGHASWTPDGGALVFTAERNGNQDAWIMQADGSAQQRLTEHPAADFAAMCRARGVDPTRYGDDLRDSVVHAEEYGMWDLRFNLHMLAQGGLFLWPARSMVAHTGYDPRATNSPNVAGWADAPAPAPPVESVRWPEVVEQPGSAALWRRAVNAPPRPSLLVRAWRRLARLRRPRL